MKHHFVINKGRKTTCSVKQNLFRYLRIEIITKLNHVINALFNTVAVAAFIMC